MDFSNIRASAKIEAPIDPYDIFRRNVSKMGASGINDLWAGQRDALREWHAHRSSKDLALVLNTGAGKTLIGLLIGQSLVNETNGRVFYLCGSIQLIEQTREKAEMYGLDVTTYYGGDFSNTLFDQGQSICITTYQALFNGKSRFKNEDIEAIIFDDSHAAENLVKNCFSLEVRQSHSPEAFDQLISVFRPYYQQVGRQGSFDEIYAGKNQGIEVFPPFEISKNASQIRSILEANDVSKDTETLFAWNHLKDHLDLCSYFVSSGVIQITPPFVPVNALPYFSNSIRRVYLTATMMGEDNFIRTFGRAPDEIITPETPAGECERQLLFPLLSENVAEDRMASQTLVEKLKTLVITPNSYIARMWADFGSIPDSNKLHEEINAFKASSDAQKIVITARYDGIDLPGDTCRVLVMDGLPTGAALIDKFFWEKLRLSNMLRSLIACRVIQSLGRISRGMSDHGVVLVSDKKYVTWLQNKRNRGFLPSFIQKQLELGFQVSEQASGVDDLADAIQACLNRDQGWRNAYDQFITDCQIDAQQADRDLLNELALAESKFIEKYWQREFTPAAKKLDRVLDKALQVNSGLAAWYSLWIGYCSERAGDEATAKSYYLQSNARSRELPKYIDSENISEPDKVSEQCISISSFLNPSAGSNIIAPSKLINEMKFLDGSGTVNQTEQSLMDLGKYLGFSATRPDKEHGAGPDILWIDSGVALVMEAKTEKYTDYTKDNVGQLLNHVEWVKDSYSDLNSVIALFIGQVRRATDSASPSSDIKVCELENFEELGRNAASAYDDVASRAMPISLIQEIQNIIEERNLSIDLVLEQLNLQTLKELN